ncbi:MAG: lysylphosphatidylglycerol synthase transmembrane domain-containing protein [Ferruginibacter sp.]
MTKKIFTYLQYILFLGAGIFLVWWQLNSMNDTERREFYGALKNANYWLVIPVVIMSILSHISRSMRWKLLMEPLGYNPKLSNVFAVTMVGYLANLAVPRLGEILKCTFLAREEHLKVDKLVGTILVERTFDFFCFLLFIAITVLIQVEKVSGYFKKEISSIAAAEGMPLWAKAIIIIALILLVVKSIHWLMKKYPSNKFITRIDHFFHGIGKGFAAIRGLKRRWLFVAHTLFIWSMYLLQVYLGFFAFEGTANLDIKASFSVLSLATLAMIATPGGIGSFPFFVMETLSIYGISESTGKAFGWLIWGANTVIVLVIGSICLIYLLLIDKKRNENYTGNPRENIFTD